MLTFGEVLTGVPAEVLLERGSLTRIESLPTAGSRVETRGLTFMSCMGRGALFAATGLEVNRLPIFDELAAAAGEDLALSNSSSVKAGGLCGGVIFKMDAALDILNYFMIQTKARNMWLR